MRLNVGFQLLYQMVHKHHTALQSYGNVSENAVHNMAVVQNLSFHFDKDKVHYTNHKSPLLGHI
jgi:hypothetical protein